MIIIIPSISLVTCYDFTSLLVRVLSFCRVFFVGILMFFVVVEGILVLFM